MNADQNPSKYSDVGRKVRIARQGDDDLGPLKLLPGTWKNETAAFPDRFKGRGWNMIALPFEAPDGNPFDFRVLVNQYNEILSFSEIDGPVPNRGINRALNQNRDQFIFGLDYQQAIKQIIADDMPQSTVAGDPDLPIHHEPGFFLYITNEVTAHQDGDLEIARLGSIPHGNGVLTMGVVRTFDGPPQIPTVSGLPVGVPGVPPIFSPPGVPAVPPALNGPYLGPYAAFSGANAFRIGEPLPGVTVPEFPGFDVAVPNNLLMLGMPDNVVRTTELHFDTKYETGNIVNIPFVERQADASEMIATFWIMELDETDPNGKPVRVVAYSQTVFLDFFPRPDGVPGLIRWPHVSINMMLYDSAPDAYEPAMMRV